MSRRSNGGVGFYAASEAHAFIGPLKAWAKDGTLRGVLYLHGHNGDAFDPLKAGNNGTLALINSVADVYPVLSIDAGGKTAWGDATAVARVTDGVTYLQGTWGAKSGTVLIVAFSMGFTAAANYALANPTKVGGIVGLLPIVDLNDMQASFGTELTADYSGGYSDATYGAQFNPQTYRASLSVPQQLWHASDDTTALPASIAAYAAGCPGVVSDTSVGALGHTQAAVAAVNADSVLSFLAAHA